MYSRTMALIGQDIRVIHFILVSGEKLAILSSFTDVHCLVLSIELSFLMVLGSSCLMGNFC